MRKDKEKQMILQIIELYKDMPYLWDQTHVNYKNKYFRIKGQRILLEIFKGFDPEATIKSLNKKLQNLKTNYIKELKKVKDSIRTGVDAEEVYKPTLYYYDALSFIGSSNELCSSTLDSLESENDSSQQNSEIEIEYGGSSPPATALKSETVERKPLIKITKPTKRTHSPADPPQKFSRYDSFTAERPKREEDECDVITKLWARKLKKLPEERRDLLIYKINSLIYGENLALYNIEPEYSGGLIMPSPIQVYRRDGVGSPSEDPMSSDG